MRIVKILAERKISCLWSTVHEGCHIERASVSPSQIKHLFLLLHIRKFCLPRRQRSQSPTAHGQSKIISQHNFKLNASGFWSSIVANGNKLFSVKHNLRGLKTNQNIKLAKSERIRIKSVKENLYIRSNFFSLSLSFHHETKKKETIKEVAK